MFRPRRYGMQRCIKPGKICIELTQFALTPTAELSSIVQADTYWASDIVSPEPQQDNGKKHRGKDRAKLMGVCSKTNACCHIDEVPLKQGQMIVLYMGVDFGWQSVLIQNMFGIKLHLLKWHKSLIVIQGPYTCIGRLSGLFLYDVASEDRLDGILRKLQA